MAHEAVATQGAVVVREAANGMRDCGMRRWWCGAATARWFPRRHAGLRREGAMVALRAVVRGCDGPAAVYGTVALQGGATARGCSGQWPLWQHGERGSGTMARGARSPLLVFIGVTARFSAPKQQMNL